MRGAVPLFQTVSSHSALGLWRNDTVDARKVADFLGFDKRDVARIAGVAAPSVRFDQKMPTQVRERFEEIANVIELVAAFFDDDAVKAALWFKMRNPMLGQLAPRELIRGGRFEKLRRFVMEAVMQVPEHEAPAPRAAHADLPPTKPGEHHALIDSHLAEIAALCRQYGAKRLGLFGSILRADFDPGASDVDVVVEFRAVEGLSPARQYFDFKTALERVLGRPVDLVELSAMPDSRLRRSIERAQVPIYAEAA